MIKKSIIIISTIFLLQTTVYAFSGKVYFGKYFEQTLCSMPSSGIAEYIGGIEVWRDIHRFKFYIGIETLMDECNNLTFHPASVKYIIGSTVRFFDNVYLRGEHSCWHPIDNSGTVEQYHLLQIEYRFGNNK